MIIIYKIFITPLLIATVTLAGRCWGPVVSGLLIGLPLTTGPVSFILAHEYGLEFATKAAIGSLAGQLSMCIFCLVYSLAAKKWGWLTSSCVSLSAFLLATPTWNLFAWELVPAAIVLLVTIALILKFIPYYHIALNNTTPPNWDLPARMIIATTFVVFLTTFANMLGPQLSGLIAPFPVFGVVLAAFNHFHHGAKAASNLLRGIVLGSVAYTAFFLIVGTFLSRLGIGLTYFLAAVSAALISGAIYFINDRINSKTDLQDTKYGRKS